ncbi:T-box protein [Dirofilaria immitis]
MARTGEKRPMDTIHMNIPASGNFPDIPLDLAAPKRFKFMIDYLLDTGTIDEKGRRPTTDARNNRNYDDSKESVEPEEEGSSMEQLPKTSPLPGNSHILRHITCRLEGRELWNKFYELSTEMIITKSGRRMFPTMKLSISGCEPDVFYYVFLDVVPVDNRRYRYIYNKSSWLTAGKAEPTPRNRLYMHPDSPFTGEQLCNQVISFEKAKLTNNEVDKTGHLILNSMHKYQPRIHVVRRPRERPIEQALTIDLHNEHYKTFQFKETQFMAVTAYQNQLITKLKIEKNPFAKGFRDPNGRSPEYDLDIRNDGSSILLPNLYTPTIMQQALIRQYWADKMHSRFAIPSQFISQMFFANITALPVSPSNLASSSATTSPPHLHFDRDLIPYSTTSTTAMTATTATITATTTTTTIIANNNKRLTDDRQTPLIL